MAMRLSSQAPVTGLLNPNQCGSLAGLTTFDAAAALTHDLRSYQLPWTKVSTLFLDIKVGFDNNSAPCLTALLRSKRLLHYMVSWVRSFLQNHQGRFVFQGSPCVFSPVSVGTPQGSSVSPLLFVVYVSCLHISIPRGVIFSYVDDFSVTVTSSSYRRNVQHLWHVFSLLFRKASAVGVSFSVPKTELIHWRTSKDRDLLSPTAIHLNCSLFRPSSGVWWLGYWFTPSLETSLHFRKRFSAAQGAFVGIKWLSPPGAGLPPYMCRKLAHNLVLPILTYGADLFVPTRTTLDSLMVFWNNVLQWVTNCFSSTPVTILPCEACLPPLQSYLSHKRGLAAVRLMCSSQQINPAAARLSPSLPIQDSTSIRPDT